ncbi:MAG: heparan-alpha-glucosaminide N-acetyltransferase domain-containing protein [Pyrinomonadaceae bacterium MAG19_C2-C3]|nr:heparan-alpha-glucosaminide N-acetyltransferase domain-containing protein [Pyrinomonadaceae bacterium MAG19_C2-C3]
MSTIPEAKITPPASQRLLSLDAFRGMTIAGMILVNNPGSWTAIYSPLEHAAWHGWTPTDFVFPFFLFIVGVSITLSFARRAQGNHNRRKLLLSVIRRALIIFGLGLLLSGFPYYDLSVIRIPGVLQRIALCYFFASLIFLKTNWRTQSIIVVVLLLGYWMLMTLIPTPGFAAGDLSKEGNLAAYLDRTLLAGHIYTKTYDPEGLLSTLPAIATTLCGVLTGHFLRSNRTGLEKVAGLFAVGAGAVVLGWAWHGLFPINKALWTSSYVAFTAGLSLQLLAICYWLIDVKAYKRWATPFVVFGVNAITVYVLSGLSERVMTVIKFADVTGKQVTLKSFLYESVFTPLASPLNASLAYAICYVLVWLGLMWILYHKRIFLKV